MNEKTKLAQRAVAQHEFFEYLIGKEGYAYTNRYADMPTDPTDAFTSLVDLYNHVRDPKIWTSFSENVERISSDKSYAWLSLYYVAAYLRYTTRRKIVNPKDPPNALILAQSVLTHLKKLQPTLSNDKKWVGRDYTDGLWGDIERMVHNLNEEFHLVLEV